MGKKEKIILLLICFLSTASFAQENDDNTYVKPGLFRTFGCFAFDYRFNQNVWDYRLHGFGEYYLQKNFSAIGEVYYYLDSGTDLPIIDKNTSIGSGFAYHWAKNRLDPYVFVLAIGNLYRTQKRDESTGLVVKDEMEFTEVNPGCAFGGGLNLYVWKYLHFFVQARYNHAFSYSPLQVQNLDAFSVSYGIGFNFQTRKNKE